MVGTIITDRPPAQIRTSASTHTALTMDQWRQNCLPHTAHSLGHAVPALCREHVGLNDVPHGPCPCPSTAQNSEVRKISQQLRSWGCNSRAGRPDFGPSRKNASENEALYCCCDGADSNGFMVGQIASSWNQPLLSPPEQLPGLEQASPLRTHAEPHPPALPDRTSLGGNLDFSGR